MSGLTDRPGTQIPFSFNKFEQLDFDLFVAGPNHLTKQHLLNVSLGTDRKNTYLWGNSGSGKSHLLQAVCTSVAKTQGNIAYIPLTERNILSPNMLEGLQHLALVCLDDIEQIAGDTEWELAVFHLFNQLRDAQTPLIISALHGPLGSPIQLPDLKSRLSWDNTFHLQNLDESASREALIKRAQFRGFDLPEEVADYLMKRVARDTHNLFELLNKLDNASLVAKKKLTIPFVKTLLD
jgi:DnaA-homolog protein